MRMACGIDIVEIARIKKAIERSGKPFLNLVYTPGELAYCRARGVRKYHAFAGRFAVKEAVLKAFSIGMARGMKLNEIEVINRVRGTLLWCSPGKLRCS